MRLHRNVKIRLSIVVVQFGVSALILPFLAIYFAKYYSAGVSGVIMIVTTFGSIASSFLAGYFSDKYGRKSILIFGSLLRFASAVVMVLANFPGHVAPWLTAVGLFGINVGVGFQAPPLEAMVVDVTTEETRKRVYTLLYWLSNVALVIGTLLGAFLLQDYFFELAMFTAIVDFIAYLVIQLFLVESASLVKKAKQSEPFIKGIISGYGSVFRDRTFLKYLCTLLLTMGLEKQLGKFISVRLGDEFQTTTLLGQSITGIKMFGLLSVENSILAVVLTMFIAKWLEKIKITDRMQLFVGIFLFTLGFVVLAFANNVWLLLLFMLVLSIGEIMYSPVENVVLAGITKEETRTQYMAANMLTGRISTLIASVWLTISPLLHSWGMAILYGAMGLVAILIFNNIFNEQRKAKITSNVSVQD